MGKIYLIAAIGENNELGKDNKLIWHLPGDLQFFKEKTLNKVIVMGYNTFKSLGRILPKRVHIVITSKDNIDGVLVFNSIEEVLNYIKDIDEVYVIGGASIYNQFIDYCDGMYLTEIDKSYDADVYFPKFNEEDFDRKVLVKKYENDTSYSHVFYERKK